MFYATPGTWTKKRKGIGEDEVLISSTCSTCYASHSARARRATINRCTGRTDPETGARGRT